MMWIDPYEPCTCFHHRLLYCIRNGSNDDAKYQVKFGLHKLVKPCNEITNSGTTFLHGAVEYKNTVIVQYLINQKYNVNAQDSYGVSPLMLAIEGGNVTTVDILMKNNADVYVTDHSGTNSLQMAAERCLYLVPDKADLDILKNLFEKLKKDFFTNKNMTVRWILSANNPMKLAAVAFGNIELAKIVLKNDYPIDFGMSSRGSTTLHGALAVQNIENVKLLIEHGASVDAKDNSGYSALSYYISGCQDVDENSELLNSLLNRTTGLHLSNESRRTELEYLLKSGNEKTVRTVIRKVQSAVDITTIKFKNDNSLLHVLLDNRRGGNLLPVLDELDIQYDVDAQNYGRPTALMTASRQGLVEAVEFLLKRGTDVNLTIKGSPVLFYALKNVYRLTNLERQNNMVKISQLLLEYGADAQFVIIDGKTLISQFYNGRKHYTKILYPCVKVILAHLALLGTLNQLTCYAHSDVNSDLLFRDYFELCTKQLEEMKNVELHGNVTLFKLLAASREKLVAYSRNQELIVAFNNKIEKNSHLEPYYFDTLLSRVARATEVSKLEEKVACIIENLTGISCDVYCIVVDKIIRYFNCQDLEKLCKIESVIFTKK